MRKEIKSLGKHLIPRILRKIYYGRLKSRALRTESKRSFYEQIISREWNTYPAYHQLRCSVMAQCIGDGMLLDIGSGNGMLLQSLSESRAGAVVSSDLASENLIKLRSVSIPVCFDIAQPPLKYSSFHAVSMGEILEHLRDPDTALKNACALLQSNGRLVLTVPSKFGAFGIVYDSIWSILRGYNAYGHVQRFTAARIKGMLEKAGFEIMQFRNLGILGFFYKSRKAVGIDYRISRFVPKDIATGWVIVAGKSSKRCSQQ